MLIVLVVTLAITCAYIYYYLKKIGPCVYNTGDYPVAIVIISEYNII